MNRKKTVFPRASRRGIRSSWGFRSEGIRTPEIIWLGGRRSATAVLAATLNSNLVRHNGTKVSPIQIAIGRDHNSFGCECQNKFKAAKAIAIKIFRDSQIIVIGHIILSAHFVRSTGLKYIHDPTPRDHFDVCPPGTNNIIV